MNYFSVGLLVTFYLYFIENKKSNSIFVSWLFLLPPMYIYFIILALQYQVGTDYRSYMSMYIEGPEERLFYNREYLFYYLVEAIRYFKLGGQSIFVFMSLIQTVLAFYLFNILKKYGYKRWLIFFLFFFITGIYFNQMNILRQYIAILCTPIFYLLIFEKKYFKSILIASFAVMFHNTFWISILILPFFIFLSNISKNKLFIIFLSMPIIYLYIYPLLMEFIFKNIFSTYAYYLEWENRYGLLNILPKLYYLPLWLLFWLLYLKNKIVITEKIANFLLIIFVSMCFSYLMDFAVDMYGRVYLLFNFFTIVPIYYIFDYYNRLKRIIISLTLTLYIILPFIVKVFLFPIGEYSYKSILLNYI